MKLIKYLYPLALLIFFYSCGSDDASPEPQPVINNNDDEDILQLPTTNSNPPVINNNDEILQLPIANTNPGDPGIGSVRNLNSFDFVAEMGVGWNLGNSLDVVNDADLFNTTKTEWGNPLPSKAVIDKVAETGFKTLRLPVSWRTNQNPTAPYQIEAGYLQRVKNVVDWAMSNDMHVILNIHHDNEWLRPVESDKANANARLKSTWTQIATYFEAYNEQLIFEVMNEPRLKNVPEEWNGGSVSGRRIVNEYTKTAVDAIRDTKGNNSNRQLMITPWAGSAINKAMDDLIVPNNDPNIIITIHTYFPFQYALNGEGIWGSDQEKADLRAEFENIKQKWIVRENRPVILGEWGTRTDKIPTENRIEYAKFYVEEATKRGLLTVLWDDGGNIGLLDRRTLRWRSQTQADAIVESSLIKD